MIRLLAILALLCALAAGAAFVADNPGTVRYDWLGRSGAVTIGEALLLLAITVAALVVLAEGARVVLRLPRRLRERAQARRRERGFAALSEGLVAVASGDLATARKGAAEARRHLPEAALTALLDAQSAQLAGDRATAVARFRAMTEDARTLALGLRGLCVEAARAGDDDSARAHARAANRADPTLPWAAAAAFDAATADHDWTEALRLNDEALRHRLIDRTMHRRRRAVLLTARAMELAAPEPEAARRAAIEAHGLAPDLVPAALVAARLAAPRSRRQAASILETTYAAAPHPDVFSAMLALGEGQGAADRLERAQALAPVRPDHPESALGVARAARDARAFATARAALAPFAHDRPTQRVCVAMAEIEAADSGDEGRVREWLARGVRAPRDPVWTADGQVLSSWQPVSPVTGVLDRVVWRVPEGEMAGGPAIDLAALAPVRLPAPEAPQVETEVEPAAREAALALEASVPADRDGKSDPVVP